MKKRNRPARPHTLDLASSRPHVSCWPMACADPTVLKGGLLSVPLRKPQSASPLFGSNIPLYASQTRDDPGLSQVYDGALTHSTISSAFGAKRGEFSGSRRTYASTFNSQTPRPWDGASRRRGPNLGPGQYDTGTLSHNTSSSVGWEVRGRPGLSHTCAFCDGASPPPSVLLEPSPHLRCYWKYI